MALSSTRLAQIRELSNDERVDTLDTTNFTDADWARIDQELTRESLDFCRTSNNPEELHAFASTWNWDKGTWALSEIVRNPVCEAATALMIYWHASPEYFLQFANRAAIQADPTNMANLETFDLITDIQERYMMGKFPAGIIAYDPASSDDNRVGVYDDLKDAFVRQLPAKMYQAICP